MENLSSLSSILIILIIFLIGYIAFLKGWFGNRKINSSKTVSINFKNEISNIEIEKIISLLSNADKFSIPNLQKIIIKDTSGFEKYAAKGPLPPVPPVPAPIDAKYVIKAIQTNLPDYVKYIDSFEVAKNFDNQFIKSN